MDAFARYENYITNNQNPIETRARLLQYGRTAGIITDLVVQQLRADEVIPASMDRVIITSGCQEALALCLSALCPDRADVVLVCNPTYFGAAGAASATGVRVFPIPNTVPDLIEGIVQAIYQLKASSRQVRALYLIPTFDNPNGRILDEDYRRRLLEVCAEFRVVVLEDNPYGMFQYEGDLIKPMAALDKVGCVIYLSTYSKTIAPALRIGAASLPETLFGEHKASKELWHDLVQRKGALSVNTNQITQAIVGGLLLEQKGSLRQWVKPALAWYRENRDVMVNAIRRDIGPISDRITWNCPSGGFFLSMDLPFKFDAGHVAQCATDHGVIVMPMSFFAFDESQDHRIRLAFSSIDPPGIRAGITSLAEYLKRRLENERDPGDKSRVPGGSNPNNFR